MKRRRGGCLSMSVVITREDGLWVGKSGEKRGGIILFAHVQVVMNSWI